VDSRLTEVAGRPHSVAHVNAALLSTLVTGAVQYTDAESRFVYWRARYYDPTTGQFLTRDPLVALTWSAYGHVGGIPLNATDPLGLWCPVHNSRTECTSFAESVSLATGALSTVATLETTAYACANSPRATPASPAARQRFCLPRRPLSGIRLGEGVLPTLGRAVVTDANAAVNTATLRSRPLSADPGQAGCPK
jgi:RHS repeat-associated protein